LDSGQIIRMNDRDKSTLSGSEFLTGHYGTTSLKAK
jgi:hypothetical protein